MTQIDLTGPFEVLSRLPNATHRIDAKSRDGGSRGSSAQALRPTSPAALFLRSDAARWINGANLPVDGGLEASINATGLRFSYAPSSL